MITRKSAALHVPENGTWESLKAFEKTCLCGVRVHEDAVCRSGLHENHMVTVEDLRCQGSDHVMSCLF
jgi:hypothetical protein